MTLRTQHDRRFCSFPFVLRVDNPSVSFADSSLYTREPFGRAFCCQSLSSAGQFKFCGAFSKATRVLGVKPLVADRSQRRSVKKTCQWQVFSVGHACFTGMVRWFLLICKGEFLTPPKRGETHARGFPFHVPHYKRRTSPPIPQSAHADSSLCTREPWVGASGRYCRRPSSCAFLGQVLQNHQFDPEKAV